MKQSFAQREHKLKTHLLLFIVFWFFGALAILGWQNKNVPKTYSVSLTQEQWGARLKLLSDTKEVMRKSSYPGTIISSVTDSLDVLVREINEQVGAELQRETAKAKADTSKPKK